VAEGEGVIRVLLADEQSLFRNAVRVVLSAQDDIAVVAEAADGTGALWEAERALPDVAVVDADLPNPDGIRTTRELCERLPGCRVIVTSAQEDERILMDALEAGARGYLSKASPMADLIETARAVHRGDTRVPSRMLDALLQRLISRRRERDDALLRMASLTRREREVLSLLATGSDNDGIAQHLVISPDTARTHIQNVMGKLRVHSRLEAVAFVTQNGLLDDLVGAAG
jgi:DNA-binding NarL/FixJ family response regulator